jgi:hypothetical protein
MGMEGASSTHIFIVEFQSKPGDDADSAGSDQFALFVRATLRGTFTEVRVGDARVPELVIRISREAVMESARARNVVK